MNGGLKSCANCEYPKMSDFQKREVLPSKTPKTNTMPPFSHHPIPSQKKLEILLTICKKPPWNWWWWFFQCLPNGPTSAVEGERIYPQGGLHKFSTHQAKLVGCFQKKNPSAIFYNKISCPPQNEPKIAPWENTPKPKRIIFFQPFIFRGRFFLVSGRVTFLILNIVILLSCQ